MVSLIEKLAEHAVSIPERTAFELIDRNLQVQGRISFGKLWNATLHVAKRIRNVAGPGDRVLVFVEPGIHGVPVILGCMASRTIPVPLAPPGRSAGSSQDLIRRIAEDCSPTAACCDTGMHETVAQALTGLPIVDYSSNPDSSYSAHCEPDFPSLKDIAFIQYTSGSTAAPKGVVVTHANIVHNQRDITEFVRSHADSTVVSWLPMHHDMGLIGDTFNPIWSGCRCIRLKPIDFLRRPASWLLAVSKYSGTITGGPNFAFRAISMDNDRHLDSLNLNSLECWYCGAEPIRPSVLNDAMLRFERHGLRSSAMFPCYGLAESTLFVSGIKSGINGHVTSLKPGGDEKIVACGQWAAGRVSVSIESVSGTTIPGVGEIVVTSNSISPGYWDTKLHDSGCLFDDIPRVLRTGDLGFIEQGQLHVCGRIKNTLNIRGRNVIAEELETLLLSSIKMLAETTVVAIPSPDANGEGISVLIEGKLDGETQAVLKGQISRCLIDQLGFTPSHVVFIRRGALPRTTSGKVKRYECVEMFLNSNPAET